MLEKQIQELSECYLKSKEFGIAKFIELAHSQLSLIENDYGEVIYSSKEIFTKGKYYFLGLNPGGEGYIKIAEHLNKYCGREIDQWSKDDINTPPLLKKRAEKLFNILGHNLCDVFCTNLIFKTTKGASSLNYGLAGLCWGVHLLALSIVQPDIIITCGNDNKESAFSFILDLYSDRNCDPDKKLFEEYTISEPLKLSIKFSKIHIQDRPTLLIGLPHLSRFNYLNDTVFQEKIRELTKKG